MNVLMFLGTGKVMQQNKPTVLASLMLSRPTCLDVEIIQRWIVPLGKVKMKVIQTSNGIYAMYKYTVMPSLYAIAKIVS